MYNPSLRHCFHGGNFTLDMVSLLAIYVKDMITPFRDGNIHAYGDVVTRIEVKPDIVTKILAGIYKIKEGILDLIPDKEYFGMDSLIRKMIDLSLPITHYPIEEYWLDIEQAKDYEKAQEVYKDMFE